MKETLKEKKQISRVYLISYIDNICNFFIFLHLYTPFVFCLVDTVQRMERKMVGSPHHVRKPLPIHEPKPNLQV